MRFLRKGYGLEECDQEEKAAFADTLLKLTQLTWAQVNTAPRHGLGYEKIDKNSIKGDAIPASIKEDANLIAFRFCGKKPMVGYRDGVVFHIIWLDRGFTLYDHG